LGKAWHEEDLAHLAWEHATQEGVEAPAMARAFAGHIDELSRTPAVYLTPNIVLALYDDIRELTIGPVRARFTEDVAAELNRPDSQ
jgi:hypothetical protein